MLAILPVGVVLQRWPLKAEEFLPVSRRKPKNDALALCMEVGACLEAHKINEKITHSLCFCRESPMSEIIIRTSCGICQERLSHWGGDVLVAVSNTENKPAFKTLRELMPYHWSMVNDKAL